MDVLLAELWKGGEAYLGVQQEVPYQVPSPLSSFVFEG